MSDKATKNFSWRLSGFYLDGYFISMDTFHFKAAKVKPIGYNGIILMVATNFTINVFICPKTFLYLRIFLFQKFYNGFFKGNSFTIFSLCEIFILFFLSFMFKIFILQINLRFCNRVF